MMGEFRDLLSVALAIVSIATLAGLGLLRGVVTNLREQLKDERDSNQSLRADRTEDRATISRITADLDALTRVVTGEAHWIAIGERLEDHHDEAKRHWGVGESLLATIREESHHRWGKVEALMSTIVTELARMKGFISRGRVDDDAT